MNIGAILATAQGAAVPGGVTVESALLPPIVLLRPDGGGDAGDGQAGGEPTPPPLWLRIVRPKITAQTIAGAIVIAPGGDPPAFPVLGFAVAGGLVVLVALAAYGAVRAVRG